MTIGSKIRIKAYGIDAFIGQQGVIEGIAPDHGNTLVFKVRVGDMILPGWFKEADLEELPRPYTTLIFDIDGTLADASIGILNSVQFALSKLGMEEPDLQKLHPFLLSPVEECFKRLYHMNEKQVHEAMEHYRGHYKRKGIFEQKLYPDMAETLKSLKSEGYRLAAASSRTEKQASTILLLLDVRQYIDAVGARDKYGRLQTKADILNSLVGYMGLSSSKNTCVFIGDTRSDIEDGRLAGISTIAATWGYGTLSELRNASPNHMVNSLQELKGLL